MSVAQEPYIPSAIHNPISYMTSTTGMDLNNMLGQSRQPYERYPNVPEQGQQQMGPGPQLLLPMQSDGEPATVSTVHESRIYSLDIVQQPIRARMCGFGDKDRRPITPPPCIRLIVRDFNTKQEIDINDIDTSYFVLSVDLWSADATKEVNLVRHSATSPSISAATSASYPPNTTPIGVHFPNDPHFPYGQGPLSPHHAQPGMVPISMPMQQQQTGYPPNYGPSAYPKQSELVYYQQAYKQSEMQQHQNSHHHHLPPSQSSIPTSLPPSHSMSDQMQRQGYYTAGPVTPSTPTGQTGYYPQQGPLLSPDQIAPSTDPRAQPGGMFTRNLIGSLCVSAFKLADTDNRIGVWFVLQDLSVRTEGTFRLKLNFVNVGQTPTSAPTTPSSSSFATTNTANNTTTNPSSAASGTTATSIGKLNTGSAPVLASCFSNSFEVFSAKKFPGVIESTKLSKCFATQGIKIPIRKDGVRGNERGRAGDEDED